VAEQAPSFGPRVIGGIDALLHIAQRFLQHLAHLARHGARDFFFALRQEVPGAPYHIAAQRSGRSAPAFESAAGAGCGPLDIKRVERGQSPIASEESAGLRFSKY
jgi:hypothetical protein